MESKLPFILITVGLIFALGFTIANLERDTVIKHWEDRRCELPVVMAGMFFKPDSDPRTKGDFAKSNFEFCMKSYMDKFMSLLMAPINFIFGKHLNLAAGAADSLNIIRDIAQKMYNAFLSFMDPFIRRFNAGVFEMSRIIQYLRMAMERANAMVMSMLYTGITMYRGMLNTIQFVIKVVLIICGIMLAIIIILIFILFPFIPLILAVLGVIVATVLSLAMVMTSEIANQAESDKGGFCFSSWTIIATLDRNGNKVFKPVSQIKIGDELAENCGKVTAVIQMDGRDIPLHYLNGILVSGSHLVKGTDGEWKSVAKDERAIPTNVESGILYCFNTTTHNIPVCKDSKSEIILFRDWEEIAEDDEKGQYEWNYIILKMLNKLSNYESWKDSMNISKNVPLMSKSVKIKCDFGYVPIERMTIGINNVLDSKGQKQKVLGVINGEVEGVDAIKTEEIGEWNTEVFELINNIWVKSKNKVVTGTDKIEGMTIITESGEFIIWDENEKKDRIIRDFTDVGYKTICETYPFVGSRLRTKE
jgi:hypothetical protein